MGVEKAAADEAKAIRDQIAKRDRDKLYYGLMAGGVKGLQSTSPFASVGIGNIGQGALDYIGKQEADNVADLRKLLEQGVEGAKADQARNIQERNAIANVIASEYNKEIGLANVKATAGLAKDAKADALYEKTYADFQKEVEIAHDKLIKEGKFADWDPQAVYDLARNRVIKNSPPKRLEILGTPSIVNVPSLEKPIPPKPPTMLERMFGVDKSKVDASNPLLK
jgi:hypothetical protein